MDDNRPFGFDWTEESGEDSTDHLRPVAAKAKLSVVSIVIASLLGLSVAAGVILMAVTHLLPAWMFVLAMAVDAIVAAVLAWMLLGSGPTRRKARFWIATVLSVVLIAGNAGVVKVSADYINFGNGIQAPTTDTVRYDIVVLNDGPTDVSQLGQSMMGEVANDPLSNAVHEEVAKLVTVNYIPAPTWTDMVDGLTAQDMSSMVIQDGFMQILADANPDTYSVLRILASVDVDSSRAVYATPTPSPTPSATPSTVPTNAYVVYISGIDTYGPISARSRSDVNILMAVNPDTGKILLVNTPRDFYVQLRGTTGLKDKLTHAGVYGIDVSVGTLEDLYGVNIDYYLRINFSSLVTVVDALGGVDVNSVYNFSYGGYTFVKGMNHLNGQAALAFSRDRHDFAGGDRVRGENQQRVIEAIIKKVTDPKVLMGYDRILSAVQNSIQTSMPQDVISDQIRQQLTTGRNWSVSAISVTGSDASEYTFSYPGQRLYVMVPDQSTVDTAIAQIQETLTGQ